MTGTAVETNDVARAAASIALVASELSRAEPGGALLALTAALPGGSTAARASVLEECWHRRWRAWSRDARAQARAMAMSAHTYVDADDAVTWLLRGGRVGPGLH